MMSDFAYKVPCDDTSLVRSIDCGFADLKQIYYCPYCSAKMTLCAVASNKRNAYFRSQEHKGDCPLKIIGYVNISDYDINDFTVEKLFRDISNPLIQETKERDVSKEKSTPSEKGVNISKGKISTIRLLYGWCVNNSLDVIIGERKNIEILCNSRSAFYYSRGIYGLKLVECEVTKKYVIKERDENNIYKNYQYLKCAFPNIENKKYDIIIKVYNEKEGVKISNKVELGDLILVFSEFNQYGHGDNMMITLIENSNQIIPLK